MKSIDKDCDDFMKHTSNKQLIPPNSPDKSDTVEAPQFSPRIGHEYQVEILSMLKEPEQLQLLMNPADSELVHDNEVENSTHEACEILRDNTKKDSISNNGKEVSESENDQITPDTLSNSWSDAEVKSFLLGLFIFGKNFVQIQRFLENKGMGEIMSFYYGKFYKSDEYCRWSDCKKLKGRKCITGHKLFSGQKQQELLSRLIPRVSEEFQDSLIQASKSYTEGKTSLEKYISSLKSAVGLGVLVEAVGIGKAGEEDLTNFPAKPRKKNRVISSPKASTNNAEHMKKSALDTSSARGGKSSDSRELNSSHSDSASDIDVDVAIKTYKKVGKHANKTNHKKAKLDSINHRLTMFTVVDTSLLYEGKLSKVSEFRYPPAELKDTSKMYGISRKCDSKFSDDNSPRKTEAAILTYGRKNSNNVNFQRDATSRKEVSGKQDNIAKQIAENGENQKKHQLSQRARSGNSNLAAPPPIKRRRLTACVKAETNRILEKFSGGLESEKLKLSKSSCLLDANKNASDPVPVCHQKDASLVSSSAEGSAKENNEEIILNKFCVEKGNSFDNVEKCESQTPINFNATQVLLKPEDEKDLKPNDIIPRRHSTRNRPLTVRALESLANEFLHVQRKQKRKKRLGA